MKIFIFILTTFLLSISSSALNAEVINCSFVGPENIEEKVAFKKEDNDIYNITTRLFEIPAKVVYENSQYLTLVLAQDQHAYTFVIDRENKYFEASYITLFMERELNKVSGDCF
tara:strand:- start:121 stop:462 length:342 start_codon:yes stop_codon:yes gene_type:complete